MLYLVQNLDKVVFRPRCYIVGKTDALGVTKATAAEESAKVVVGC